MAFEKLTQLLDGLVDGHGVPGSDCVVIRNHEVLYRHMRGYSDYDRKVPVSDRDMYYLYSCTKVVTNTAILKLVEDGRIHLYDPVAKYLPEFEYMKVTNNFDEGIPNDHLGHPAIDKACHYAARPIRIIDLCAMMGGLSYQVTADEIREACRYADGKISTRGMMAAIAKMPLLYEPGTRWYYSLCHDVLGGLIEEVSGKKFGTYLKDEIFSPLGIEEDITFHLNEEQEKRLAAIYKFNLGDNNIKPCARDESYMLSPEYDSGGAGLIGTVNAYSTILDALACGGVGKNGVRILKEDTVKMFSTSVTTGQALKDIQRQEGPEYGYGIGVRVKINTKRGRGPVGEFGWGGAAGAYVCVDPVDHLSIFYAQHVMNHDVCGQRFHPQIRDLAYEGSGI